MTQLRITLVTIQRKSRHSYLRIHRKGQISQGVINSEHIENILANKIAAAVVGTLCISLCIIAIAKIHIKLTFCSLILILFGSINVNYCIPNLSFFSIYIIGIERKFIGIICVYFFFFIQTYTNFIITRFIVFIELHSQGMKKLMHNNAAHALGVNITRQIANISSIPARIARPDPNAGISIIAFITLFINVSFKLIISKLLCIQ